MKRRRVQVSEAWDGLRLDACLALALPELSRAQIKHLIQEGRVSGPGSLKPSERVRAGWEFELAWTERSTTVEARPVPFDVVYADDDLVVVNKPAGLVVHPAPGNYDFTLVHGLLDRFGSLASLGAPLRPGIVHRLDKDTSGLLVVARTDAAYKSLVAQIAERTAKREYVAVVCGHLPQPEGDIEAPLARSRRDRKQIAVDQRGREARTRYRVREAAGPCDVVDLQLDTGRTHQIRVHLRHVGKPVLGDPVYGGRTRWATTLPVTERQKVERALRVLRRQALHAARLRLAHPRSGEAKTFEAELPEDIKKTLEILRH